MSDQSEFAYVYPAGRHRGIEFQIGVRADPSINGERQLSVGDRSMTHVVPFESPPHRLIRNPDECASSDCICMPISFAERSSFDAIWRLFMNARPPVTSWSRYSMMRSLGESLSGGAIIRQWAADSHQHFESGLASPVRRRWRLDQLPHLLRLRGRPWKYHLHPA